MKITPNYVRSVQDQALREQRKWVVSLRKPELGDHRWSYDYWLVKVATDYYRKGIVQS